MAGNLPAGHSEHKPLTGRRRIELFAIQFEALTAHVSPARMNATINFDSNPALQMGEVEPPPAGRPELDFLRECASVIANGHFPDQPPLQMQR